MNDKASEFQVFLHSESPSGKSLEAEAHWISAVPTTFPYRTSAAEQNYYNLMLLGSVFLLNSQGTMSRGNTEPNCICLSSSEPEKIEDAININTGCVYCSYLKVMYLVHNIIIQGILLKMTDSSFLLNIYRSTYSLRNTFISFV